MMPYFLRLACLCLAAWFLVHLVCGLAAAVLTPLWLRVASRRKAAVAARILLAVRLAPLVCSLAAVYLFCVPSYLWLEPQGKTESLGLEGVLAAGLGLALIAEWLYRVTQSTMQSSRFSRRCHGVAREEQLDGEAAAVLVLDQKSPCLALVGIVRPRIVVSRGVLTALSADELSAALAHERAHRDSRDNLKRLALFSAPGLLPFVRSFRRLEREWAKLTEWAADDAAAAGDAFRPVTLAGALVRFARLGAAATVPSAATSMLSCHNDLAERVDRLLHPRSPGSVSSPLLHARAIGVAIAVAILFALPASLPAVHRILEHLMD